MVDFFVGMGPVGGEALPCPWRKQQATKLHPTWLLQHRQLLHLTTTKGSVILVAKKTETIYPMKNAPMF